MASYNHVFLYGQVMQNPNITINEDTNEPERAFAVIKVIHGTRDTGTGESSIQYACPLVMTSDPDRIKEIQEWEQGDMVEIKGTFCNKNIQKASFCPSCHAKNLVKGTLMYIHPIYTRIREKQVADDKALALLIRSREISNCMTTIGELCRDPFKVENDKGYNIVQFPIAIDRHHFVKGDDPSDKTDYPFVKSFGRIAVDAYQNLSSGSMIYLDGFIQTRTVTRHTICEECKEEYEWNDSAMEIVPYAIEYLRNYGPSAEDTCVDS